MREVIVNIALCALTSRSRGRRQNVVLVNHSERLPMVFLALNFVVFQLLWAASVIGAGAYRLHFPVWVMLGVLTAAAWFSPHRTNDAKLAALALGMGLVIDNLWVWFGILSYPASTVAPYWIGALWFGLGLTVNHSLRFFRDRGWLGALIVGAVAPLTYLTGERFGAVVINSLPACMLISVSWVLLFRILIPASAVPPSAPAPLLDRA